MKRATLSLIFILCFSLLCACGKSTTPNGEGIVGTWYADEDGSVCIFEFTEDGQYANYLEGNEDVREFSGYTYDSETGRMTFDDMPGVEITSNLEDDYLVIDYIDDDVKYELYRDRNAVFNDEVDKTSTEYLEKIKDKGGWCIEDGILYVYMGNSEEVTVPEDVSEIYENAFSGDYDHGIRLVKVTVPGTVKRVDDQAFAFTNADVIIFEEGVEELGDNVFSDAYIDEVHFPESLTSIGTGILNTEEGLDGTKIFVTKGSKADKYFKEYEPYGTYEIKRK